MVVTLHHVAIIIDRVIPFFSLAAWLNPDQTDTAYLGLQFMEFQQVF